MDEQVKVCDRLAKELVFLTFSGKSAMNPSYPADDPHHLIPRSKTSTRHSLLNLLPLTRKEHSWSHENPRDFHNWLRVNQPDRYQFMKEFIFAPPPAIYDLDQVEAGLRDALATLKGEDK